MSTTTCSGNVTDRPGLSRALNALRESDALVVWKLDRIGRSLAHVVELVGTFQKRGVGLPPGLPSRVERRRYRPHKLSAGELRPAVLFLGQIFDWSELNLGSRS